MKSTHLSLLAFALCGLLSGCQTPNKSEAAASSATSAYVTDTWTNAPGVTPTHQDNLTLEKIMADPDWLGRQPLNPGWSADGRALVFDRKQAGSVLNDTYAIALASQDQIQQVTFNEWHRYRFDERVQDPNSKRVAYRTKDSIFIVEPNGDTRQLTQGGQVLRELRFMADGRLMGRIDNKIMAIDLDTGQWSQLLYWAFADEPMAVKPAKDVIAAEQHQLIRYIAQQREQKQQRFDRELAMATESPAVSARPYYFDKGHRLVTASMSADGRYALIVTTEDVPSRADSDIMPHYIQDDGRIAALPVRRRVADATPVSHAIWLIDVSLGEKHALSLTDLPGYNDDVLAAVKQENASARGEKYTVNRLPRAITLLESWYWREPAIRWHNQGANVAMMLKAWDNKDRWIVTVDVDKKRLVTQHRLHDDAWVNYRYNQFGWLHHSPTLFYQSEESGYAHLYVKPLQGNAKALTKGRYVVDNLTLTQDDGYIYYQANKKHPGVYEVYRVNLTTGEQTALTDLNGMTEYQLSPDEQHLLLTHSKTTQLPELYLQAAAPSQSPKQLTHTASEAFTAIKWRAPQVVAVPSSHTEQPIYARVYLPENYEQGPARKAVIFNHGAGYLQNAHLGWSTYFREFMFHQMLVQQGYVVMDMDYRASAGYGRDWRTAIYRHMGKPEIDDLRDGVEWMVTNANVDRQRVGTYGGSYGGFMTFMALFTQPDLFQAGAALRPVSDWAHYNTPYTSNILNTPEVDPIAYRRSSPIYFAEGLQKPLLINAPMVDDNVFFVDVVRLVQRLIELEKTDFETAIYPVEPHGFVQPSSWLDEYRRIYKLFETHL